MSESSDDAAFNFFRKTKKLKLKELGYIFKTYDKVADEKQDLINAVRYIQRICKERIHSDYIGDVLGLENIHVTTVHQPGIDPKRLKQAVTFILWYPQGTTMRLKIFCAQKGHGLKVFNEFLKYIEKKPRINKFEFKRIRIESVSNVLFFWKKCGFKFQNENADNVINRIIENTIPDIFEIRNFYKKEVWIGIWVEALSQVLKTNGGELIRAREEFEQKLIHYVDEEGRTLKFKSRAFSGTLSVTGQSFKRLKRVFFDAFQPMMSLRGRTKELEGVVMTLDLENRVEITESCYQCYSNNDNLHQEISSDLTFCNSSCQSQFYSEKGKFEILC